MCYSFIIIANIVAVKLESFPNICINSMRKGGGGEEKKNFQSTEFVLIDSRNFGIK